MVDHKDKLADEFQLPETPEPSRIARANAMSAALKAFDAKFESTSEQKGEEAFKHLNEMPIHDTKDISDFMKKKERLRQGSHSGSRLNDEVGRKDAPTKPEKGSFFMKYKKMAACFAMFAFIGGIALVSMPFVGSQLSATFYYVGSEMPGMRGGGSSYYDVSEMRAMRGGGNDEAYAPPVVHFDRNVRVNGDEAVEPAPPSKPRSVDVVELPVARGNGQNDRKTFQYVGSETVGVRDRGRSDQGNAPQPLPRSVDVAELPAARPEINHNSGEAYDTSNKRKYSQDRKSLENDLLSKSDEMRQKLLGQKNNKETEAELAKAPAQAVPPVNRRVKPTDGLTFSVEPAPQQEDYANQDSFKKHETNPFKLVKDEPVSTFSLDVDTASYSFMRAALSQNRLPRADSVRVEEFVNYFPYDYPQAESTNEPFKTTISVVPSPWSDGRKLMHVGVKSYAVKPEERPRANIVFLIDTSGSMRSANRLPLAKNALNMLVEALDPEDTISIVTYAGSSHVALEPTPVKQKRKIIRQIDSLNASGSTAGAQGLKTAYELAEENFDKNGVNRIILASDGDFNVGMTNREEMKTFISRKREQGIFLSVLGFGMGNYKDDMMQTLAQNGNGVAAYIDTLSEARKVLVQEATSSIIPIAKDVKIQVEFNPNTVVEYRLVGYEKRLLRREDFNNDKVDAGEVGSGHTVTAIYEFVPKGGKPTVDPLRYQTQENTDESDKEKADTSGDALPTEYALVKMRYKLPKSETSVLREQVVDSREDFASLKDAPQEARFAIAVASFAEILREDRYSGSVTLDDVIKIAQDAKGDDLFGYRTEFVQLVRLAKSARKM